MKKSELKDLTGFQSGKRINLDHFLVEKNSEVRVVRNAIFRNCHIKSEKFVKFVNCNFIDCNFDLKISHVRQCFFLSCEFKVDSDFPRNIKQTTFRECQTDHISFYLGCGTLKELDIDREMTDKFLIHAVSAMSNEDRTRFLENPLEYIHESKFFEKYSEKHGCPDHFGLLYAKKGLLK